MLEMESSVAFVKAYRQSTLYYCASSQVSVGLDCSSSANNHPKQTTKSIQSISLDWMFLPLSRY